MVKELRRGASHYARYQKTFDHADRLCRYRGAAGGMRFAFLTCTNAVLESGVGVAKKQVSKTEMKDADFVITGEGRLD